MHWRNCPPSTGRWPTVGSPTQKARAISRLADADTIDELIDLSEACPAGRLGVLLAAWQQERLSPSSVSIAQYEARSLSRRTEPDGMTTLTVRLPPIEAGTLEAAIDSQVMRTVAPAGASLSQSRADALVALLTSGGNVSAEVLIHVARTENDELQAALPDGTPVPDPQLSRILCESTIRALVHDSEGSPVDASPARPAPTTRQLRLLHQRHRHCRYPGCTARSFLHAHHLVHREHGGPTVVANLILLCSFHHRMVHEVGWPDGCAPAGADGSPVAVTPSR